MNPRVLVLCVASAFFPVAASADNAKLTPAKEADIRRLLEITGAAKLAKQIMSEMRTNIRPLVMKALPPGAYRERLVNLFFERFQSKMDAEKLVGLSVPLYTTSISRMKRSRASWRSTRRRWATRASRSCPD